MAVIHKFFRAHGDYYENASFLIEHFYATSYKSAFPKRTTPECQAEARAFELAIHQDATSKEQYYQRCNEKIDEYNYILTPSTVEKSFEPEVAATSQEVGQKIGPYTNCIHHITGLFSTIYKTQNPNSTGPGTLAIKLTIPSQCQSPHDPRREARLLRTTKHPNVISLLETHSLPSSHFLLVFPFQPLDLGALLRKASLSKAAATAVVKDLFTALAYLHSLGIIHRDIKPSNILLSSPTGPAYLADFGITWSPNDSASEAADQKITDVGTTCYRAPELLFGQKAYTTAIDLWAAGCVVAEIVNSATSTSTTTNERRGEWTLFNAGALGSELALVKSIFETLGTPTERNWPVSSAVSFLSSHIDHNTRIKEVISLPDWNKMTFVDFPGKSWEEILPNASARVRNLVSGLVRYQSTERMSAADVAGLEVF